MRKERKEEMISDEKITDYDFDSDQDETCKYLSAGTYKCIEIRTRLAKNLLLQALYHTNITHKKGNDRHIINHKMIEALSAVDKLLNTIHMCSIEEHEPSVAEDKLNLTDKELLDIINMTEFCEETSNIELLKAKCDATGNSI